MRTPVRPACLAALFASLLAAQSAAARGPRGGSFGGRGLPPVLEAGVRGGYDYDAEALSLGVLVRAPLGRRGTVQLVPAADLFVLEEDVDWQANLDAILQSRGPVYVGGGVAASNRHLASDGEREVQAGYNLLLGMHLPLRNVRFRASLEGRWTYLDGEELFRLAVNLTFPLGRPRRPRSGL